MAAEITYRGLGELVDLTKGISYRSEFLDKEGPLLLGLGAVVPGGGLRLDSARRYGGPVKESARIKPGELLIATTDVTQTGIIIGSPALVPEDPVGEYVVSLDVARVRIKDADQIDANYLYYVACTREFRGFVWGMATGTTVRRIQIKDLLGYSFRCPPLPEQRTIAHILGTLDDKIELNRLMNETLKAIALAIFKSWFVDFDPVHAKAAGHEPVGVEAETAALFPDSFEESDQGLIPAGWHVKAIGDICDVVGGSTPSTTHEEYWEPGIHYWATPKDLAALQFPCLLTTNRSVSDEGLKQISSGLLAEHSVLMSSRAPIGYLAINEVPVAINQGFIGMKPHSGVPPEFLLAWASWAQPQILSRANGSTFLEISKSNFRPIPAVIPDARVMAAYGAVANATHSRLVLNEQESATLASLRNMLLPKLLSGELRVPDAEKLLEDARL